MRLKISNDGNYPLYHKYSSQTGPQPAFCEIDLVGGTCRFDYDGEIGNAVPMAVWNGYFLRIAVSNQLSRREITELYESEDFQSLVTKIMEDCEEVYDGQNYTMRMGANAAEALIEFGQLCVLTDARESENDDAFLELIGAGY